tara:strand:- start:166 stop:1353 length:1188 start_codon:yes stop_codon:yes gene_type:complete
LIFQALDEKEKCIGIYSNGEIHKDLPEDGSETWKYASFLKNTPVEYASIYCEGKSLGDVCPPELKEDYDRIWSKLKAFYKSFTIAKVSLQDHCFFDLVPEGFLKEFCLLKDKITRHVLDTYPKPENYENMVEITKLVTDIKYQKLNIDLSVLNNDLADTRTKDFYRKIMRTDPYIKYNPYGTKTGRLTTEKNSFPVLTMDKKFRKIIKPTNDWFVEFDYNAAEVRVMLGLLGKTQPYIDLHDYNAYELFDGKVSRDEAKKKLFSWLYNPNAKDEVLSKLYDRDEVKKLFWDGKCVKTIYHREIPSDEYHALNYIIQSTCSDLILDKAIKVADMLEGKKSKIAFIIHDSIVLDYADEDGDFINMVYWEFMQTPFGRFKANVSGGRSFGDMKELWIF